MSKPSSNSPEVRQLHQKIAKNVRKYRLAKEMTQEEVAGAAGFDRAYMGYIERAERRPSVAILARIAKVLNVELQVFFDFG